MGNENDKITKTKVCVHGGKLQKWNKAVLHVGCEAVLRCANVFEGVKGYWQNDGRFGIVMLKQHYERLRRSARLLHIPFENTYDEFKDAIEGLIKSLLIKEKDMWARPTLFAVDGYWGEGTVSDLVVTAYNQDMKNPSSINLGVSTWQRSTDISLPARIKTGSNYQVARLARIEGRAHGCDDMVLLNQWGRVAEATGSCVLMVRDGTIYTPPVSEGALESITINIIEALSHLLGIKFVRRPIDRTELIIADEIAICGTLSEVTLVKSIEGIPINNKSVILEKIQKKYLEAVRGSEHHAYVDISYIEI